MTSLFPAGARVPLVEFRAGKMVATKVGDGPAVRLVADPRKGKITVTPGLDGAAPGLVWAERGTADARGAADAPVALTPGAVVFEKVENPTRPTDRVYCLRITATNERRFFWMQARGGGAAPRGAVTSARARGRRAGRGDGPRLGGARVFSSVIAGVVLVVWCVVWCDVVVVVVRVCIWLRADGESLSCRS